MCLCFSPLRAMDDAYPLPVRAFRVSRDQCTVVLAKGRHVPAITGIDDGERREAAQLPAQREHAAPEHERSLQARGGVRVMRLLSQHALSTGSVVPRRAIRHSDGTLQTEAVGARPGLLIAPSEGSLLALQRTAGNRAVSHFVGRMLTIQRHTGILPEIAAAHTVSKEEEKDLPTPDETKDLVGERSELWGERKTLWKKARKAKKSTADKSTLAAEKAARDKRLKEIEDRLAEIAQKLKVRQKGDEEETLRRNGLSETAADWFAKVRTITFLGRPATVHERLAGRLGKAEAALQGEAPPQGGWVKEGHSTLREPGQSLHSFGLAIDLNPGFNPFLVNPDDRHAKLYEAGAQSRAVRDVIDRAVLLVLGRSAAEEQFFAPSEEADKSARVEATYDKLAEASRALERYFTLDAPEKKKELDELVLAHKDEAARKLGSDGWAKRIADDRKELKKKAKVKHWRKPETGFLALDKRLVKAMTDTTGAGLTWLGEKTVASGRDIMHFDLRGVGPIKKIWSSVTGKDTYLGGD
jgi:hypothetical protein